MNRDSHHHVVIQPYSNLKKLQVILRGGGWLSTNPTEKGDLLDFWTN